MKTTQTTETNILTSTKVSSNILYSESGVSFTRIRAFIAKNLAICSRDST